MQQPHVAITNQGPVTVVEFTRACISDVDAIREASQQIANCITQRCPRRVIFDFDRVRFFSSQVLGVLLEARFHLLSVQGQVLVSAVNPQLLRVFKITNLDRIFKFYPNRQSAIDSLVS